MSRLNLQHSRIEEADVHGFRTEAIKVPDAATYTVLQKDSGKVHILPDLTASCTISLPAEAPGLNYEFMYAGAAADAHNWVITSGNDVNFFLGGVTHIDLDGDTAAPVYSNGNSNSKLTINVPEVGTSVKFWCDGVKWWVNGIVCSATVPAFADQ